MHERPLADSVAEVQERIAAACQKAGRQRSELKLIAVTKTQDPAILPKLTELGLNDYGENRVEHLQEMLPAANAASRFHYIGRVQSRQLAKIVPHVASLHSLADPSHIMKLQRACQEHRSQPLPIFIQVNTAGEAQKAGLAPEALPEMLDHCAKADQIQVLGLMAMAPDPDLPGNDTSTIHRCFARLRELAQTHGLPRLSMGMSKDFAIAIEEGATDLRIGSVLFS